MVCQRRRTDTCCIEKGQLTPFDIAYNLHYATQVYKIAPSMVDNQPYHRPISDEQKIPSTYYSGHFKKRKRTQNVDNTRTGRQETAHHRGYGDAPPISNETRKSWQFQPGGRGLFSLS